MFTEKRPEKEIEEPKLPQIQEIEDTPNTSLFVVHFFAIISVSR
jgi:hypothetical protein